MKRLILGGLSVLLAIAATAPAKASAKEEGESSNKGACQSIPLPSPSGEAYLARLQAIQRCDIEVRSRGPEMSSSSLRQSNPPDKVLSPSSATAPAVKAEPVAVNFSTLQSTSTSTVQLTPRQLVSLAYSGYFQKQGIPGFAVFNAELHERKITAKDLVRSAVEAHKLPAQVLTNREYLQGVHNQIRDKITHSRR